MKVYALFDKNKGYCYNDDDTSSCNYDFNIDEYTLLFRNISNAEFNLNSNEEIIELEVDDDFYSEYLI